jgi:hypothetical protein
MSVSQLHDKQGYELPGLKTSVTDDVISYLASLISRLSRTIDNDNKAEMLVCQIVME